MATKRLENIVSRQRGYLVKDILMAALASVIFILQLSVLSGTNDAMSAPPARLVAPTLDAPTRTAPFEEPDVMSSARESALAQGDEPTSTPGS